jgi:NADH-quinone oxidoreductase subunit A
MILNLFSVAGLTILAASGISLLFYAFSKKEKKWIHNSSKWNNFRFGYITFALIFLSFDMEMIFMYPWAVVFADIGLKAFLDMLVFIGILSSGILYSWGMGGLDWE